MKGLIAVVLLLILLKISTFGQDSTNDQFEVFYEYIRDADKLYQTGVIYGILKIDSSGSIKNTYYWSQWPEVIHISLNTKQTLNLLTSARSLRI
ncbi:hypothetical protein LAG90_04950 [Marinilongibacter aquaticus]|uniref:hypothetical protein n=1 Tax=Marinilongibacter aquaticus TaxID=2975157 RepID=UPI0021BD15DF|nr:hypothetical protein [Marinilongibacter aquaticus]UBM59997.1 hypothetical protein LAG90_04950 [Marinilongibacter aquaticus]